MQDPSSKPLPPLRSQITLLAMACGLPALLAVAMLLVYFQQRWTVQDEAAAQRSARAVAALVDRELRSAETLALAMAGNPGLRGVPLPSQYHALLTEGGAVQQLAGSPLALDRAANTARLKMPANARSAASLLPASGKDQARLAVDVPLPRSGRPPAYLSVLLPPALMDQVMDEQPLPAGAVIAVLSPNGRVLARSQDDGRSSGMAAADVLQHLPLQASYSRAPDAPWSVTVAAPAADPLAAFGGAFLLPASALLLLVLSGAVLAALKGRRLAHSIRGLVAPAQALGAGAPLQLPAMAFAEAQQVGQALQQLEQDMARHRHDLEQLVEERTAQLENSNALLETIYATAPVGLSFVDTRLRILMINDYLANLNGMPVNDHIGRRFDEVISDRQIVAQVNQAYRRVLATGEAVPSAELAGTPPSRPGRQSTFIAGYYPVFGADGVMVGITAMLMDITQQKEAEAALRQSKSLFKSVLENMPAMVFVKDAQHLRFELLNRQGELILGRPRDDMLGKSDRDFFSPEQAAAPGSGPQGAGIRPGARNCGGNLAQRRRRHALPDHAQGRAARRTGRRHPLAGHRARHHGPQAGRRSLAAHLAEPGPQHQLPAYADRQPARPGGVLGP